MKEQEDYFDRQIADRLSQAGADAPLSWPEMERRINRNNRRGRGWLFGVFGAVILLVVVLMVYTGLRQHPASGTSAGKAELFPAILPSKNTLGMRLYEAPEAHLQGAASGSSSAPGNVMFYQAEAPLSTHAGNTRQVMAVGAATTAAVPATQRPFVSAVSAKLTAGRTLPAAVEAAGMRSSSRHGYRGTAGSVAKGKRDAILGSSAPGNYRMVTAPGGRRQGNHRLPAKAAEQTAAVHNAVPVPETLLSIRLREYRSEPCRTGVDAVLPSGIVDTRLQQDELSPALVSVYGTGSIERVNYRSLLAGDEQLDFQQKVYVASGFGMLLGYQMSPRYSVHLGLEFSRREISFDWTTTGVQTTIAIDSQWVQVVTPDSSYYAWAYDTAYSTKAVREKIGYSASVAVLTIPVVVHYSIVAGAWIWMPYAGLEYNTRTTTRLIRTYNSEQNISINTANLRETMHYLTGRLGIKLTRRLHTHIDAFTGLDFRYTIPMNRNNFRGASSSLQLGVILHR